MIDKVLTEAQLNAFMNQVCLEIEQTGHTAEEKHVFSCYEEAAAALSQGKLKWPAIILGALDGRIASRNDNNTDVKSISFAVLQKAGKEDWAQKIASRDQCLDVSMRIVERMYQYHNTREFFQVMELGTAKYFQVSSKLDSSVGYEVTFEAGSPRSFKNQF
jgi:hypothetical protein